MALRVDLCSASSAVPFKSRSPRFKEALKRWPNFFVLGRWLFQAEEHRGRGCVRVTSNMLETILGMLEELKQHLLLFMRLVWNAFFRSGDV